MFAALTHQPDPRVFWVSDAVLVGLSRTFIRFVGQLARRLASGDQAAESSLRDLARQTLHILLRDPFALAAVVADEGLGADSLVAHEIQDIWEILIGLLARRFSTNFLESGSHFPFAALRPLRYRPDFRQETLPPPEWSEAPLVNRVFSARIPLLLLFRNQPSEVSRQAADLTDLTLALFLAEGARVPEIPPTSAEDSRPLAAVLQDLRILWPVLCADPKPNFDQFFFSALGPEWPDGLKFALCRGEFRPELAPLLERVGNRNNRSRLFDLVRCHLRWDNWWKEVPGARELFATALQALRDMVKLPKEWEEQCNREKLEALADFAAGAAHEINNPLAVIAGHAQLLLREENDPEKRRALALIMAQTQRAHEMIADTRLFARPPRPKLEPVDAAELIKTLMQELQPLAEEARVQLTYRPMVETAKVTLLADRNQLLMALAALVKNSIEAVAGNGQVVLSLRGDDRTITIQVEDNGPGIPEVHRPHIFNPFYSSRQAGRGLGMGLPKAWRIIQQHQGKIEIQCPAEGGTVFRVVLPRREPASHGPNGPAAGGESASSA